MGCRTNLDVRLTVAIPQISTSVNSESQYKDNIKTISSIIKNITDKYPFNDVDINLNTGDHTDNEMLYLSYTGSCIESGDEGQVSRGNRLGGVISSRRPFSIEGLSGKNPSYHAGKLYSVAAWDIAQEIWKEQKIPCEIYIASQIDRPLDDPWVVIINSTKEIDISAAEYVAKKILDSLPQITNNILEGKYPLV